MKKILFLATFLGMILSAQLMPFQSVSYAQDQEKQPVNLPNPLAGQVDPTGDGGAAANAPVYFRERLGQLLSTMFRLLAIGALLPTIVGGVQLMISQGGDYAQKGKKTLYWGVVGLLIALSGVLIFDYLLTIFLPQ